LRDWQNIFIQASASIHEAIKKMTINRLQICLVVNGENGLLGTVTDGDIRCGILKGLSLDNPVDEIMNSTPTVAGQFEERHQILNTMRLKKILQIPIVDEQGRVIGLETLNEILNPAEQENIVVLMAGGMGTRLKPLTNDCPKPMLSIGNKPILETIINNFVEFGFKRFYLSVNYMADMVTSYFGDGSRFGLDIRYIHEDQKMGTAGALGHLPVRPSSALLVMNADLITKINFNNLLSFHKQHSSRATMCVREYDFQVPYGVVQLEGNRFIGIEEKPVKRFFVNAGIYVLEPDVLDYVPSNTYFDMPQLFEHIALDHKNISVFPISEYWLDIGQMNDYMRAVNEHQGVS
jgi:dTDP-glucose pyrophosphorylase/predicted transcriptional regulator